jgi:hypothetical protein
VKKWHFTLKNGAFTPRIQSILALFLGDILWKYFMGVRGVCENIKVSVCFTTRSRIRARVALLRPARHFM